MTPSKRQVLIDALKTSNEVMKKQIELSNRTIELLGEYVTEPESLTEQEKEGVKKAFSVNPTNLEKPIEPTNIKPEDMVRGEWYVIEIFGFLNLIKL